MHYVLEVLVRWHMSSLSLVPRPHGRRESVTWPWLIFSMLEVGREMHVNRVCMEDQMCCAV